MAYCVNGCWTVLSNVGIGTDDFATYHPAFMAPSLNIVGSRPGVNFENNAGSLSTIRLKGTAPAGEMHINFDGTSCTNGRLYFYAYGCANRSLLTLALNGNVGIGVDVPFSPHNGNGLVVKGNGGRGIMELWDGSALAGKSVFQNVEGDTYFGQLDRGTGCGRLYFLTGGSGTSATISMTILCNGNTGIGTTSPSYRLQVCGNEGAIHLRVNSDGVGSNVHIRPNSGRCGWVSFTEDAVADRWGIGIKNGDAKLYFSSGNVSGDGGTARMVLDGSGFVGIGATSPTGELHICASQPALRIQSTVSGNMQMGQWDTVTNRIQSTGRDFLLTQTDSCNILFNTCGTERVRITGTGNVGIGITTPFAPLEVYRSCSGGLGGFIAVNNNGTSVGNETAVMFTDGGSTTVRAAISSTTENAPYCGDLKFKTGVGTYDCLSTRMIIKGNGTVGINTTSPSYKLHVNGTFYAAGSSIKYKEGICNYDTDSCLFMCLKPVTYQYKDEWQHLGRELKSQSQIGLIAEDVAEVMPELAVLVNEEDEKVVRNVDYEKLSVVLLKEVQKLRLEVDQLKNNK